MQRHYVPLNIEQVHDWIDANVIPDTRTVSTRSAKAAAQQAAQRITDYYAPLLADSYHEHGRALDELARIREELAEIRGAIPECNCLAGLV